MSVISTYLNDNAQTPLNRFVVYMLYKQVCNRHGDKTNRLSLGLSLSVGGLKRRTCDNQSPSCAHLSIAARQVARRIISPQLCRQEALLWQRDRATRLSVEIMQLQNIPIVWHYLRDPAFSRFYTIPECDRHTHTDRRTDRYTTTAGTALSITSRGKNWPYCTAHQV